MADETTPTGENPPLEGVDNQEFGGTALAEAPPAEAEKLEQTVEINDVGPCKKHIKVTVDRTAIDDRFHDKCGMK